MKAPQAGSLWLRPRWVAACAALCLGWTCLSSALVYPYSLSYFNELAGGPRGGPRFLLGSNTDFAQDMLFLRKWVNAHEEARPLTVAWHTRFTTPKLAGLDYPSPPLTPTSGWHIVSVNEIYADDPRYRYFLDFEPVGTIGYSMNIYHLTDEMVRGWEMKPSNITEQVAPPDD